MKAPTSDLIIVQGAYLNLSSMKAPTSDDELKSCKKCWKRLLAMLEWSTWHMDMKLGLLSLSKHKANITELHPKVRPTCSLLQTLDQQIGCSDCLGWFNIPHRLDSIFQFVCFRKQKMINLQYSSRPLALPFPWASQYVDRYISYLKGQRTLFYWP